MNAKKMSNFKPVISVIEACRMLQLSRSRYYQLIKSGFLPKPKIDERSQRPYYDAALQEKLLECRQTGIGVDGSILMFYTPRTQKNTTDKKNKAKRVDPVIKDYVETLKSMGLETTAQDIQDALKEIYPEGTNQEDQGLVVRELFRYLKQK